VHLFILLQGMSYLEERGIVHRDLAARNVLGIYLFLYLTASSFFTSDTARLSLALKLILSVNL